MSTRKPTALTLITAAAVSAVTRPEIGTARAAEVRPESTTTPPRRPGAANSGRRRPGRSPACSTWSASGRSLGPKSSSAGLTGPETLTSREQVEIIAEVRGRSVDFEDTTPHEFAQAAIANGTPPEQAHTMEALYEVFRARHSAIITDDVENLTGTAPEPSATGANATWTPFAETQLTMSVAGVGMEDGTIWQRHPRTVYVREEAIKAVIAQAFSEFLFTPTGGSC